MVGLNFIGPIGEGSGESSSPGVERVSGVTGFDCFFLMKGGESSRIVIWAGGAGLSCCTVVDLPG